MPFLSFGDEILDVSKVSPINKYTTNNFFNYRILFLVEHYTIKVDIWYYNKSLQY